MDQEDIVNRILGSPPCVTLPPEDRPVLAVRQVSDLLGGSWCRVEGEPGFRSSWDDFTGSWELTRLLESAADRKP